MMVPTYETSCREQELIIQQQKNKLDKIEKILLEKIEAIKTIKDMLGENAIVVNPHIEILEKEYKKLLEELKGE